MTKAETVTNPIPEPDIEEVNPLAMIASLERDLQVAQAALRKILHANPSLYRGGDTNKYFGRKHEQAFEHCRDVAFKALNRMENYVDEQ